MSWRRLTTCFLVVLLVAALGAVPSRGGPAHAGTTPVITFDDLNVPAGGRATVNTQYAAQGVTFNDVSAIDYSQPPFPAGFAHSGTVGIEQCFAVEFCSSPIAASFTAGQRTVSIRVGLSFPSPQPIGVRLTAFDAAHVSVGTAAATLPANATVTPIQTALSVTVTNPTIRSIEVSVPGGVMNGVAADDLELSSAGPPPPCDADSVPTVELSAPTGDSTVQNNEFLLQGSVGTAARRSRAPRSSTTASRAPMRRPSTRRWSGQPRHLRPDPLRRVPFAR